jgi:hypothetical protein
MKSIAALALSLSLAGGTLVAEDGTVTSWNEIALLAYHRMECAERVMAMMLTTGSPPNRNSNVTTSRVPEHSFNWSRFATSLGHGVRRNSEPDQHRKGHRS